MIHELRTYRALPNKLSALNRRFKDTTLALFARHGIRPIAFWTIDIGPSNHELIYILQWDSMAEREQRWSAFVADPEWTAAREASEKDGPLVANIATAFLRPTSYSPLGGKP